MQYSEYFNVDYGTPQGSCLGPLLFLIFNNNIHRCLTLLRCILFADDTTLFKGHANLRYLKCCFENELLEVEDWFRVNGLTLNLNKTECVLFGAMGLLRKDTIESIQLGDLEIKVNDKVKFLGMWLDRELKFQYHTNHLVLKLKRNLHLLRVSQNLLNEHSKRLLYSAHIQSHSQYGLVVWGPVCTRENMEKINKCQELGAKLINKTKSLHGQKLLTIDQLTTQELCKWGKLYVNSDLATPIMRAMNTNSQSGSLKKNHKYNIRNKQLPNNPNAKTSIYQKSYFLKSLPEYSKLHCKLKNIKNIALFKNKVKNHIMS